MNLFKKEVPSKSRSLKEIRKIYPGAEILKYTENDVTGVMLNYLHSYTAPDGRKVQEQAPILKIMNGKKADGSKFELSKEQAAYACVIGCFRQLGFQTTYVPGFPSGRFKYEAIPGFVGPEAGIQLPDGVDPALPQKELAAAMNEHVRQREAELASEVQPTEPAAKENEK